MKQLKDCKCIELPCQNCPLRIFGCTAVNHSDVYVCENMEYWGLNMTLSEILNVRIDTVSESVKENQIMRMVFDNAVAMAQIALLNYIDEEELLSDD